MKKLHVFFKSLQSDNTFLNFVLEQLQLRSISPQRRRYSPKMLSFAYFWRNASTHCYKMLSEFFSLPAITTLNRLSCDVPTSADEEYFKLRTRHLKDSEKTMILLIDEIYTAERLELNASGELIGLTESNDLAKTVLVFMVTSLKANFSEVVFLLPVRNLTSDVLVENFLKVLSFLSLHVLVQAVSVDNHVVNRKLYSFLHQTYHVEREDSESIIRHPFKSDDLLFLLFDSTPCIKNVFNNFHTRRTFTFIGTNDTPEKAHFNDLNRICTLESGQAVRGAHKLSHSILNPTSTSKVSPKHALGKYVECVGLLSFLRNDKKAEPKIS